MPRNITVYISDELTDRMKKRTEVNWSEIARQGIENYLTGRETKDELLETTAKILIRLDTVEVDLALLKKFCVDLEKKKEVVT